MPAAEDEGASRRQSWIGVDYFEALRHHQIESTEQLRRIPSNIANILAVRWAPDGKQIAVATGDGCIGLYQASTGTCLQFITATASAPPATCIRFRRADSVASDTLQHVLVATYTNGHIAEFNYQTGDKIRHLVEADNQIMAVDYRMDAAMFATAGTDRALRLYDETTGSLVRTLIGHTNRVFSVKYHPDDAQMILSGGWDDTVRIWDVRAGIGTESAGLIFGPHICGDAVDVKGNEVVTGSWSEHDQVAIWDLRTVARPITQLHQSNTMVYTAQFSTIGPTRIGLGGTKPNGIRVLDRLGPNRNAVDLGPDLFRCSTEGTYSSHFSPTSTEFVAAGAGNVIRVVDLQHGKCREISAVGFRNVPKW